LLLSEAAYLTLYSNLADRLLLFIVVSLFNSLVFVAMWAVIRRNDVPSSRYLLSLLIVFGLGFRISLIAVSPTASDDIYRYVWDGKVQAHGYNPYRYPPDSPALEALHSPSLPAEVNFPYLRTIYPPLAEWSFWLTYSLVGESISGFKAVALVAECVTIALLLSLLRVLSLPVKFIALYLLCPLPIMQFMVDGHVDAIGLPLLLSFVLLWTKGKKLPSYLALGMSIISKLFPLVLLPAVMSAEKGKNRILAAFIPIGLLVGTYLPYFLLNGAPLESFTLFSMNWASNASFFELAYMLLSNNHSARLVVMALLGLFLAYIYLSNRPMVQKLYLSVLGFFLLSPTVHPWYVTWLALLLPLTARWSGIAFVTLVNLAQVPLLEYVSTGVWSPAPGLLLLEYLPVIGLLLWESVTDHNCTVLRQFPRSLNALSLGKSTE
jgi:hypothetical protein